jgi:hypothetical protein
MEKQIIFVMFSLLSSAAMAADLSCTGEIDPGARYTVQADLDQSLMVKGVVHIGYQDTDGFRFDSDFVPVKSEIKLANSIHIVGAFNGGTMNLETSFDADRGFYSGELSASGNMGEAIQTSVICKITL